MHCSAMNQREACAPYDKDRQASCISGSERAPSMPFYVILPLTDTLTVFLMSQKLHSRSDLFVITLVLTRELPSTM